MAPKVTSSSNRNKRGSAKPVTKGQNPQRANRQSVSQAKVTNSGDKPKGGARITNANQRTNTGLAPVTGGSKPSLPPGQRGGTPTKPASSKPTPPRSNGGPVQPVRVRDMGKPSNSLPSGGGRGLLGPGGAPPKAVLDLLNKGQPALSPGGRKGGRVNMGGVGGALLLAGGGMAADAVGRKAGESIGGFLRNQTNQSRNDPRRNTPGGRTNPGRSSGKPATDGRYIPGSQQTEIKDRSGRQSTSSRSEAPKLPTAVIRSSSGGGAGTPSRSGSTPPRSGSTSPARKAQAASTPPSERRVSASTANRESGNYGTSKTNNPLMKDMIGRIKDREDKAQASAASKLTNNFGKDSGYQPKDKVDGSGVDTKKKMTSTTNEYNSKKRRYGG